MFRDIVAPAEPVAKLEADIAKREKDMELGIQVKETERILVEARNRSGLMTRNRQGNVKKVWERFYGTWGPGVKSGGVKKP